MSLSPYVPTDYPVLDEALKMLELKPEETLYDLGCGEDARVLIEAAKKYGVKGVGIEINPIYVEIARWSVQHSDFGYRIKIIEADLLDNAVDISKADAVYMYLTPQGLHKLRPKLENQLKPECRVVSKDFRIYRWNLTRAEDIPGGVLFLYKMDSI